QAGWNGERGRDATWMGKRALLGSRWHGVKWISPPSGERPPTEYRAQSERTALPVSRMAPREAGPTRLISAVEHVNPYEVDAPAEEERYLSQLTSHEQMVLHAHIADARHFADKMLRKLQRLAVDFNAGRGNGDKIQLVGAEARVKELASLARGFVMERRMAKREPGAGPLAIEEFVHRTYDLVRFSVEIPHNGNYGPYVRHVLDALAAPPHSHTPVQLKNFWKPGNRHYGLNAYFRTGEGHLFEVQFPTDRTAVVATPTHKLYQIVRLATAPAADRVNAFLQSLSLVKSAGVPELPGGLDQLPPTRVRDTSLADFIDDNPEVWAEYLEVIAGRGRTFADELGRYGLDASDVPGVDVNSGVQGEQGDVQVPRGVPDGTDDLAGGRPDSPATDERVPRGDLGPHDSDLDVLPGDRGVVPPGRGAQGPDDRGGPGESRADRPGTGHFTAERSGAAADLRVDPYAIEPGGDPWASAQQAMDWAAGREAHARHLMADAAAARAGAARAVTESRRLADELAQLQTEFARAPHENRAVIQRLLADLTVQMREWSREGGRLGWEATKAAIDAEQARRQAANVSGRAQSALDRLATEVASTPDGVARLRAEVDQARAAAQVQADQLEAEAGAAREVAQRETAKADVLVEQASELWEQLTWLTGTGQYLSPQVEQAPAEVHALLLQATVHEQEAARLSEVADQADAVARALLDRPDGDAGPPGAARPEDPDGPMALGAPAVLYDQDALFDQDALVSRRAPYDSSKWADWQRQSRQYFDNITERVGELQAWFDAQGWLEEELGLRLKEQRRLEQHLESWRYTAEQRRQLSAQALSRLDAAEAAVRDFTEAATQAEDVALANERLAETLSRRARAAESRMASLNAADAERAHSLAYRLDGQARRARDAASVAHGQALDLQERAQRAAEALARIRDESDHDVAQARRAAEQARRADVQANLLEEQAQAFLTETTRLERQLQQLRAAEPAKGYHNADVGRLVGPDDPAVRHSQIPGKESERAVTRKFVHGSGHRGVLLAHLRMLEQSIRDAFDGQIPRLPDPEIGTWFRRLNAFGYNLDPGRRRNCTEARAAFVRTYLHGQPRVAAPAVRSAFRGRRAEVLGFGEYGRGDEESTGGRWQTLFSSVGRPVQELKPRAERGYATATRMLENAPHGTVMLINTAWVDGEAHAWAAIKHGDKVLWLDPQTGAIGRKPLYPAGDVLKMDVIVLDSNADPVPVRGLPMSSQSELPITPEYERASHSAQTRPVGADAAPRALGAVQSDQAATPHDGAAQPAATAAAIEAEIERREALAQQLLAEAEQVEAIVDVLARGVENAELRITAEQDPDAQELFDREAASLRAVEELLGNGDFEEAVRVHQQLQGSHTGDSREVGLLREWRQWKGTSESGRERLEVHRYHVEELTAAAEHIRAENRSFRQVARELRAVPQTGPVDDPVRRSELSRRAFQAGHLAEATANDTRLLADTLDELRRRLAQAGTLATAGSAPVAGRARQLVDALDTMDRVAARLAARAESAEDGQLLAETVRSVRRIVDQAAGLEAAGASPALTGERLAAATEPLGAVDHAVARLDALVQVASSRAAVARLEVELYAVPGALPAFAEALWYGFSDPRARQMLEERWDEIRRKGRGDAVADLETFLARQEADAAKSGLSLEAQLAGRWQRLDAGRVSGLEAALGQLDEMLAPWQAETPPLLDGAIESIDAATQDAARLLRAVVDLETRFPDAGGFSGWEGKLDAVLKNLDTSMAAVLADVRSTSSEPVRLPDILGETLRTLRGLIGEIDGTTALADRGEALVAVEPEISWRSPSGELRSSSIDAVTRTADGVYYNDFKNHQVPSVTAEGELLESGRRLVDQAANQLRILAENPEYHVAPGQPPTLRLVFHNGVAPALAEHLERLSVPVLDPADREHVIGHARLVVEGDRRPSGLT
ncbi:MAG TPA: toxin glutamine deamidase domain-containing protein, partial [Cryptosporangiaceae bacterium]|nr:toxin glutamine deamidase domain-containing protein [Cryptosporangiaceae bacterium]